MPVYRKRQRTSYGSTTKRTSPKGAQYRKSSYRAILSRRPTARNQRGQLLSLSKKVNALAQVQRRRTDVVNYGITENFDLSGMDAGLILPADRFNSVPLMNYSSSSTAGFWSPIFGTVDSEQKKCLHLNSISCNYNISHDIHQKQVDSVVTVLVAKSKQVMLDYEANKMQENIDYWQGNSSSGKELPGLMTTINLTRWKILYYKRHTTYGDTRDDSTNKTGTVKQARGFFKLRLNQNLKNTSSTGDQAWNQVEYSSLPYWAKPLLIIYNSANPDGADTIPMEDCVAQFKMQAFISGSTYD